MDHTFCSLLILANAKQGNFKVLSKMSALEQWNDAYA